MMEAFFAPHIVAGALVNFCSLRSFPRMSTSAQGPTEKRTQLEFLPYFFALLPHKAVFLP